MEYPQCLFRQGNEPQVKKINNACQMPYLNRIKNALPNEYNAVMREPVFAQVFALHENGLGYSARLIHHIMCRALMVTKKKHELWFVFGRKPLRFSMEEFYAVTGLKYKDDFNYDLEKWTDDKGFWSQFLERNDKVTMKKLMNVLLFQALAWVPADRIRLMYLCVICGVVMAADEKEVIPNVYIKMVMDLDKVQNYPWGLHAFDYLFSEILKRREELKNINSYCLAGFSYALQIWAMEAVPVIGELLGEKINKELTEGLQCSNWTGAARVAYDELIRLEKSIRPKVS